jgi:predicted DNA-binding protein with PD1-like motif
MHTEPARIGRTWALRLDPGEDLLEGLRQAVADLGIVDGVFLSGIGSLTSYHVHVVSSTDLPPENAFMRGDGPFDILAITGQVMGGRVHAHLTFSDEEKAMGGHLEPGCHVLTFAIITLAEVLDTDLSRWDRVGTFTEIAVG